ncbi:UNC93-like protein MFSD11 [Oppia nitens]|uniref:UNC93-like protein MFSD11 n=1 Tax=Oppia nitens TaxID=1686743 RepID=UPI0023DBC07C|nr:UNC93-like protein MFSD11 [Oppia nitens]
MDGKFVNVILLGLAFMLIFTAFQTGGMIQQTVVKSIHQEDSSYTADGYTSLCIIYATLAIANWFAPSFILITGPKFAMFIGAIIYCLFIANFMFPKVWVLYFLSVVIGLGAAIIWTGQGNFLTINSDERTMSRNSGVFWAILQCSLIWGNLFVTFVFKEDHIKESTRLLTYGVLTVVGAIGALLLLVLRGGYRTNTGLTLSESVKDSSSALVKAFRLLFTKRMSLLCIAFFYSGLELGFFSGVYGTAIGNTNRLAADGNSKPYIGIVGILIGCGEIVGGATFGLLGSKTNRYGRDPIVILGYVVHMVSFFLIFINIPSMASLEQTNDPAYINSNLGIALFCGFLLGLGDACYNTQMYSILGVLYRDDSAPAFALFKFVQSLAAAIAFVYTSYADIHIQVLILAIFASLGTISFSAVEWSAHSSDVSDDEDRHES